MGATSVPALESAHAGQVFDLAARVCCVASTGPAPWGAAGLRL